MEIQIVGWGKGLEKSMLWPEEKEKNHIWACGKFFKKSSLMIQRGGGGGRRSLKFWKNLRFELRKIIKKSSLKVEKNIFLKIHLEARGRGVLKTLRKVHKKKVENSLKKILQKIMAWRKGHWKILEDRGGGLFKILKNYALTCGKI